MHINFLTNKELAELPPRNVYFLFTSVRAKKCYYQTREIDSAIFWEEDIDQWDDYEDEINALDEYEVRLRAELKRRPYVKLTKAQKTSIRKEKLANLKGNRNRRN